MRLEETVAASVEHLPILAAGTTGSGPGSLPPTPPRTGSMQVYLASLYHSTAALRSTTAWRAGQHMDLEEIVAESISHLPICKGTALYMPSLYMPSLYRFRSDIGIGFERKRRSHYASAIVRTASPSTSSLTTSSTAFMTATQALSTLLLHRAVGAQQPKHRPLHDSLAAEDDHTPMTCVAH